MDTIDNEITSADYTASMCPECQTELTKTETRDGICIECGAILGFRRDVTVTVDPLPPLFTESNS